MIIRKDWYTSKVAIMAIAGLLLILLRSTGILAKMGLDDRAYNDIIDAVLSVLVTLGIIHSPGEAAKVEGPIIKEVSDEEPDGEVPEE